MPNMHSSYNDNRRDDAYGGPGSGVTYERAHSGKLFVDDYQKRQSSDQVALLRTPTNHNAGYGSESVGYNDSSNYPGWEEMAQTDWNQATYEAQEVDGNEVLEFSQFIMVPPKPGIPAPALREKPAGCKTVFIGGIPPNATEAMIVELMNTCGTVEQVRTKQRFAHLRFTDLEAVDKAVFYAGWKIRIDGKDDNANCCRIHVDYAQARDDQREWEMLENERAREFRNKKRMERALNRSPTPPPAFNFHEARDIVEVMKGSDSQRFNKAINTLSYWLTKGMVDHRSSGQIFSCLSGANSAARRIAMERKEAETDLLEYKAQYQAKVSGIAGQVSMVEAIFEKAKQQKVRDHFSKSQRKTIDLWTKALQEMTSELAADVNMEDDDEMDFSDSDAPTDVKRAKIQPKLESLDTTAMKAELEGLRNEVDQERLEKQNKVYEKSLEIQILEKALQASQQTLLEKAKQIESLTEQVSKLSTQVKDSSQAPVVNGASGLEFNTSSVVVEPKDEIKQEDHVSSEKTDDEAETVEPAVGEEASEVSMVIADENETSTVADGLEARKIAVVSCFLLSHPYGTKFNAIKTYTTEHVPGCKAAQVTELLKKYPNIFSFKDSKWRLIAYENKE